jgi:peptidoglycan/xylan/chitin deacetylase (PgdA/CDA1 family)
VKKLFIDQMQGPFSSEMVRDRERVFQLTDIWQYRWKLYLVESLWWLFVISLVFISSCKPSRSNVQRNTPSPTKQAKTPSPESTAGSPNLLTTMAVTGTIEPSPSDLEQPTLTPTLTKNPAPSSTLEPMEIFTTTLLRAGVSPQNYAKDLCIYLERRWSRDGSPPGTVVVPIMFHSIYRDGRTVNDPKEISVTEFENLIARAVSLGFESVTTVELYEFLHRNIRISPRSMIMVVDDRRPGLIQERFMPVLEKYGWTVTSAYIADPNSLEWAWELMDQLYASGRVDIQSHGYSGQLYIVDQTEEDEIRLEIERSTVVLEERFGVRPIAFIWPGGNFTSLAVDIARQDGYLLGFSAYSRGPLMFNWIPLGEDELSIGDPLMLLPRAWSNSAILNMEQAVKIGELAREHALKKYPHEAQWYKALCVGELPLPEEQRLFPVP